VSAVDVRDLRVELESGAQVADVSFSIARGEIVGLVGESGSGKTTIGNALLGHARRGARITGGEVRVGGIDLLQLRPRELTRMRGKLVAYVPQDPTASLNPALRVGTQLGEMLEVHAPAMDRRARRARLDEVLEEVGLPAGESLLERFPHQLSGGQQQRVAIATAFVLRPELIVLDEPTTGLDVTTQSRVLATVRDLCVAHGVAALYVTHDLSVVASLAHRVLVAYAGHIVEVGDRDAVFDRPAHPYTRRLLAAIPDIAERRVLDPIPGRAPSPGARPPGCAFAERCEHAADVCRVATPAPVAVAAGHTARCVRLADLAPAASRAEPPGRRVIADDRPILAVDGLSAAYGDRDVLHEVSLGLGAHECLALVGESGSGKTTLARSIVGLVSGWRGSIRYRDELLSPQVRDRSQTVRRELQYIFQSPYTALNPRRTIGESIGLPIEHFYGLGGRAARAGVERSLERVALPATAADRFPDQLSGGERQRAAIARALACDPAVLICDEVTSALDVSVQAAVIDLLVDLQARDGLALLFVTHDLALVRTIADRVMVLHEGCIVEAGATDELLDRPQDPYTRRLLADTPSLVRATQGAAALPA
jgi:peptide/nickel transport system ATP-binding protein